MHFNWIGLSRPSETPHRPERWFLVLGLLGGLLFTFVTPPFQVPDEQTHLFRAYQIAEGNLIAQKFKDNAGGVLPRSVGLADSTFYQIRFHSDRKLDPKTIFESLHEPLDPEDRQFIGFNNTAVFSPLPYLSQALALSLAIPFELSPVVMMYLGRIANLALVVMLIFLAIQVAPVFKRVILLVALMPMSMFQVASLSADGVTIAISLLFTALVLRSTVTFDAAYKWTVLCAAALGLCKPTYAVLTLLALIIPLAQNKSTTRKWLQVALIPATSFALAGLWAMINRDIYTPIKWIEGVNPTAQMAYVADAPLHYLSEALYHYSISWYVYLEQMIGHLGWVDTRLPFWFWTTFVALLLLVALIDSEPDFKLCLWQRIVALCTTIVGILSVTTAIYICCNPLRGDVVRYIQGRYFIPFLTATLLCLYNRKLLWTLRSFSIGPPTIRWYGDIVLITWLIFSTVFTLKILLQRYYG